MEYKERVHKMLRDALMKAIIDKTAAYEKLENKHVTDVYETR